MDEDGFWRLSNYVPSVTFDTCDDLNVVRSAGQAFGDFQMQLSDFDAEQLFYTIPDFHNTRKRYEKLKADMKSDPCGRVSEVRDACPGVTIREDMLLDMLADMIFPAVTGFGVHPSFSAFWPTNATPACM